MKRQQSDHVCVLPGNPAWLERASYIEDLTGLLAAAADTAADRGQEDRYVLPGLTYRIAQESMGHVKNAVLTPSAAPALARVMAMPAFRLDALWMVLDVLRCARDGAGGAATVRDLVDGYGECLEPERTAEDVAADLERVLAVLTLNVPAGRDIAAAVVLNQPVDRRVTAAYRQLAAAWQAAGITP